MRIYTIGTDHRKPYDFTRLLAKFGIQIIFDVRRTPESQEDHFRRDGLQLLCAGQHVDYIYLGNELGGPVRGDMREWIESDEFRRGVAIIARKAPTRVCCVLCAERSPELCHRRTIGEHLAKTGIEVVHILDENGVWRPQATAPRPTGARRPPRHHR